MSTRFSPLNPFQGSNPLLPSDYDEVDLSQTSLIDVYTYKKNSTTVGTLTLTYTDSTKATLANVKAS